MPEIGRYGTWPSPITAARVVQASARIEQVRAVPSDAGDPVVYWSEQRPTEAGRSQIVRRDPNGSVAEVLSEGVSARSRVHEYGGAAWWVFGETVFYVDGSDQQVWRKDPGFDPEAVTRAPSDGTRRRYADGIVTPDGRWIVCIEEVHPEPPANGPVDPSLVVNRLVAVPATGGQPIVLWDAADFVAAPRLDARGETLAWISWNHPDMPWDSTTLWVARFDAAGLEARLTGAVPAAGSAERQSIVSPAWDGDGRLWFCSDRSDWWNLYSFDRPGMPTPESDGGSGGVAAVSGSFEIGGPMWQFGESPYAFLGDGRVLYAASSDGVDHLGVHDPSEGRADRLAVPFTSISQIQAAGATAVFVGADFLREPAVASILVGRGGAVSPPSVLRASRDLGLSSANLSAGTPVTFPTTGGRIAHAIVYLPANPDFVGPPDERPPVLVMIHGGPTGAAVPSLALKVQYWTSRGFAVCDVNYRGSTGFGRRFRNELRGRWGIADVEDCVAAVAFLAEVGRVDPTRCVIRGGSAGGFTTLAALCSTDGFAAGTSMYGVADLEALATETHKFESRYLDGLIGPYPEDRATYVERSPIHHVDDLRRPVIVMQGDQDMVVPPNQAEMIVAALARNSVPHAYLLFEGEGHGFRRAENIARALEAELSFYLQVFGLPHPPDLERVQIVNG